MTVNELLSRADSAELTEWKMLAEIEAEEREAQQLQQRSAQGAAARRRR